MKQSSVIGVGYGRHMFVADNVERERMISVAKETDMLHQIIFTHKADGLKTQETEDGFVLHPTNSRFKLLMMWDAFLIGRRLIRSNQQPWIVTTQDPFAAGIVGWLLSKKYKLHLVVQEHGDVFGLPYWRHESILNQIWYRIGSFILRQADVVRVVAKRVGKHVQAVGVSPENITHLPVAIDLSQFKNIPKVKKKDNTFVFITVARLVSQKNLLMLLQAFNAAWLNHPELRLVIVGRGPQETELRNLINQQYKNIDVDSVPVTIEAWSEDVPSLLAQADSYVLSSDYEGWGRVLIEALITGLPVVTTDVGCVGEVIVHEQHGLVVSPRDAQALQSAMERLATDKDLQLVISKNYSELVASNVPGTDLDSYGKSWVESLQAS